MRKFKCLATIAMTIFGITASTHTLVANELSDLAEQEKSQLSDVYRVCNDDVALTRKATISFKANLLETSADKKCLVMQLGEDKISKLSAFGFSIAPATDWIAQRTQVLEALQQRALQADSSLMSLESATLAGIPSYSCYETVEETFTAAQSIATNNPTLATWFDIGNSWEKDNGLGGYDLKVLKLTNSAISGTKPILFIQSAMHAREYTTAPLVLYFANYLVDNYGVNADATWILDYHEEHMLLLVNTDGRKYAENGLYWRNNTNRR